MYKMSKLETKDLVLLEEIDGVKYFYNKEKRRAAFEAHIGNEVRMTHNNLGTLKQEARRSERARIEGLKLAGTRVFILATKPRVKPDSPRSYERRWYDGIIVGVLRKEGHVGYRYQLKVKLPGVPDLMVVDEEEVYLAKKPIAKRLNKLRDAERKAEEAHKKLLAQFKRFSHMPYKYFVDTLSPRKRQEYIANGWINPETAK